MASKINKVKFPDFLLRTPCVICLYEGGLDENGGPKIFKDGIKVNCIFSEHVKRVNDKDGKTVVLSGKVIVKGDIAPKLKTVAGGKITVNKREFIIYAAHRPKNPDGTVNHTEFEII